MSLKTDRLKDEGSRTQVVAAGAIAGLTARFVIAPLDVLKIRLQLQTHSLTDPLSQAPRGTLPTLRHIIKNEGVRALWKGNVPAELLYVCYAGIQFGTYRSVTLLLKNIGGMPDAVESFVAGASAGALATGCTYPLDLLRTRFAAQGRRKVYSGLAGAVRDIYRHEGPGGFFRGVAPGLAQIVPYMGIFFVTCEALRLQLAGFNMPFGSADATAGMIGGIIAKTAVFPLDLIRKRIQLQGPTRKRYIYGDIPEYKSATRALGMVVRAEGVRGLFRGLPIALAKNAPTSAVMVWTYERVLNVLIESNKTVEKVIP